MNQHRLNANFRCISNAILEHDDKLEKLPEEILARVNESAAFVKTVSSDGVWNWRVWSNGLVEAWITTLSASKNCTTAAGSLYTCDLSVSLPSDLLASVESVSVTPICSDQAVLPCLKSVSSSSITVVLLCTSSANVNVQLCIHLFGKS